MLELLITVVLVLAVLGVVVYLLGTLPIDPRFKTLINVVVVIGLCIWLLTLIPRLTALVH